MGTFEIRDQFLLNGEPFKIISGAVHYFRIVPEYWRDRLEKLRNMGCNTVETYIPWNFHEPKQGQFLWEGMHDICRFIELARELGLYMILRPSPYICSEWEFGGLPAWLLKDRGMRLRCSYGPYLEAVRAYYEVLIPKLTPYQIGNGGNVILIQIENEYGYYGNDTAYLAFLRDTLRQLGVTVPLVTSDGPWNAPVFKAGMVEGALATGNFGSGAREHFGRMEEFLGGGKPMMCMEFWNGWFDAWGESHHRTDAEQAARELEELLELGSVNIYMFQGGTNFGFMSGRNGGSRTPDVTSYDYDAPLTEDGQLTAKYHAFRQVIAKYNPVMEMPLSARIPRKDYGEIPCSARVDLFSTLEAISEPVHSTLPLTMEDMDTPYGYILYRIRQQAWEAATEISLEGAADRVQVYQNGKYVATAFAEKMEEKIMVSQPEEGAVIDLLCEHLGRENFGTGIDYQRKGICGGVKINGRRHFGFEIFPVGLEKDQVEKIDFGGGWSGGAPAFYKFDFRVDAPGDTFLDTVGFGKGCAFLNGFHLGRFWDIGPQKRLYIPAPLLRQGENTIVILETEGKAADSICLRGEPDLG